MIGSEREGYAEIICPLCARAAIVEQATGLVSKHGTFAVGLDATAGLITCPGSGRRLDSWVEAL